MGVNELERIDSLSKVEALKPQTGREYFAAEHAEISAGATTDIYFIKTIDILRHLGKENTVVTAEIFARKPGVFCGLPEAMNLLKDSNVEVWALPEGERFEPKEVLMRIRGPYAEFGVLEAPLLGILASSTGWATAAREAAEAADGSPCTVFGARHVHPAVAPVMERSALVGGIDSASCVLGALAAGRDPVGTAPHALILIVGDTVEATLAYDECMPESSARLVVVDTFRDEAEEAVRVAKAMGGRLYGVRLDTASELGGVTPELVQRVRKALDDAGYPEVLIFVSGGLTPERIRSLKAAGAAAFGVGSFISGASAIDMTMDLKEVDGKPIAKRGRIPGAIANPRLKQMK
ncbi:MAG: nicotinate phosphoribosyltransferase [Firmicutes bacterium]|nr:nicotinate phosphoribosyltransferase [Bacillota bacterium]